MPSQEGSNLRPLWRFRRIFNKHKVTHGERSKKKMLICDVRSRNVHENKQNHDKLSLEKSAIYVEVKRILQKIADLDGKFAANGAFEGCLVRKFAPTRI